MAEKFAFHQVAGEVFSRIDQDEDAGVPKLKKSGVHQILQAGFDVIKQAIAAGEEVSIPQFGKFFPQEQKARVGRNPQTGKKLQIPAKTVPKFRAGQAFREIVKGEEKPVKEKKSKKGGKKKKKK